MVRRNLWIASIALNALLIAAGAIFIDKLGGIKYLEFKIRSGSDVSGMSRCRAELLEALDEGRSASNAIVFLGDSLTQQAEWAELFRDVSIRNRGVGGDTTTGVLNRLEPILQAKPRALFLMIGINDLLTKRPDEIVENIGRILSAAEAESPGTALYVESLLPVNNDVRKTYRTNTDVVRANELLRQAIAAHPRAKFVDLYPKFLDESGNLSARYTYDGLHVNAEGYKVWKAAIEPAFVAVRQ